MKKAFLILLSILFSVSLTAQQSEGGLPTAEQAARLYVPEFGKGDALVVIHGGFGDEHSYYICSGLSQFWQANSVIRISLFTLLLSLLQPLH
jgi:hypothetical protein